MAKIGEAKRTNGPKEETALTATAKTATTTATATATSTAVEKKLGLMGLDAFNVAVELADLIYRLGLRGSMRDQLVRASESVVLNISEAHPASGADRARRFQNALNETRETLAGTVPPRPATRHPG